MTQGAIGSVFRRYQWRMKKWARYATGRSIHHIPQGIGRAYQPGQLKGYFNDLTGKTRWSGASDGEGIPIVTTDRGNQFSFPITVFQKGLGHWDHWLLSDQRSTKDRDNFLAIAHWGASTLDENGGWKCWHLINRGTCTPYSSMAQGQGASILARAFQLTGENRFREAALTAANAMIDTKGALRVCRIEPDGLWLEEYPGSKMAAVLNGWAFSLIGLHDLMLCSPDERIEAALNSTLHALVSALPRYDNGYWSNYDLGGTIASPFYHSLHISQLEALALEFPMLQEEFRLVANRWIAAERHAFSKGRALVVKVRQKLHDTGNEEFS